MPKYSLKELLYWLTLWTLALSALTAAFGPPHPLQLLILTPWFLGSVAASKLGGHKVSYAFSVGTAFALCVIGAFTVSPPLALSEILFAAVFIGVIGGSLMWFVVAAAEGLFKHFSRRSPWRFPRSLAVRKSSLALRKATNLSTMWPITRFSGRSRCCHQHRWHRICT